MNTEAVYSDDVSGWELGRKMEKESRLEQWHIVGAINIAIDSAQKYNTPMAVYYDVQSKAWLDTDVQNESLLHDKIWFEVVKGGIRYPFDDQLKEKIKNVDPEAINDLLNYGYYVF